ncbi:MAG: NAD(P)H-quinone oxidoreductase [Zymomonas mobilis subsp. pomaceae]|uniref:NAD(P)H quinone oxidoreductase, PIG3 family n=1 Tax=Zymomonas mobilis subsp. pomaceae (strain ATCC 29192 / DSM 22645 / JCM 10191 / CCUG 17912 / NBRC 13757 / NCIMB 11200 / NRRL B-4491 / Barker I) TaxID=579138 RepID=F8EUU5_ZYMMT|nr:NAD(P)H-quinone oxidoreductase [Zymomonas mobilis]AEI38241.1 NAD(P)H quinone oxidoreductase, PIG3 family [Zymomonas mobilis subsp. pomaceae ATCC 29192]MDX5947930.1 NAD(P)H-quinone oxidoreductase [Zymomonas mobilis subsp. pomaceae]GEB89259.1 NAD(P)H quinone oxidoreductase [Zymomonas mobilis subsp. pomaceae]
MTQAIMQEVVIREAGGPEMLSLQDAVIPEPKAGELLIRIHAAGVNRPDILQRMGQYPLPPDASPVPGLEIAGEVIAFGEEVTGFKIGDKVCGLTNGGGYAEYGLIPAEQALPIPKGISMIEAAAIPETYFTVWANLFDIGQAKAGETVLIHGGNSGIGTTAISLAKAFGLSVFTTVSSAEKAAAVEALGAYSINYNKQDFLEVIKEKTEGKGVDIILDIIGGPYFSRNMKSLAFGGRLVIIGSMGGRIADKFDLLPLIFKRATISGSTMRARSREEKGKIAFSLKAQVWPLLEKGKCIPLIDRVFPLKSVKEAHERMESRQHCGKIVLTMQP